MFTSVCCVLSIYSYRCLRVFVVFSAYIPTDVYECLLCSQHIFLQMFTSVCCVLSIYSYRCLRVFVVFSAYIPTDVYECLLCSQHIFLQMFTSVCCVLRTCHNHMTLPGTRRDGSRYEYLPNTPRDLEHRERPAYNVRYYQIMCVCLCVCVCELFSKQTRFSKWNCSLML